MAIDYQAEKPIIHYEKTVVLNTDRNNYIQLIKQQAFDFMDELEGWCTKGKASVLIDLVFMLQPKIIVEIGVWGGKSLIPMAHALKKLNNGKAYGIDPWNSQESAAGMDGINYEWWSRVDHTKILKGLEEKIIKFSLTKQIELVQATSESAPPIENIDILHIDGNHSEKASTLDVQKWVPLVNRGGIIIFDDITWGTNRAAVEWLDNNCIRFVEFRETNDWAIWIKN